MGRQGRQIGGLALVLMGVLGVCLACGLPMWREGSFGGPNILTAQTVLDGLWLHCILQATGQTQCKRHTSCITMTPDIQAGRVLTLVSILAGLLGFIVSAANCRGTPPETPEPPTPEPLTSEPPTNSSPKKKVLKASLLGGALCALSGILSLVSVSWSAAATISVFNNPMMPVALKREVGSSIYIGWASSLLLLLGSALNCSVCREKEESQPTHSHYSYYSYMPYSTNTQFSDVSSQVATLSSDAMKSNNSRMFDQHFNNTAVNQRLHEHIKMSGASKRLLMTSYDS